MARIGTSEDQIARLGLGLAMAVAVATILWLGRGTTFWIDELTVYMQSPGLDPQDALHPHLGHLVVTVRLVYKLSFELFGSSYLPLRLLTVGSVLLTVGLLFSYMRRRVPPLVALAPCLVLLFFGSDYLHVLAGNGFGVLLAVSCGLGAFIAIESGTRRGDLAATALLCLGVCTYTVALAFLAGVIAMILLDHRRWQRIWVVAVPLLLYGTWFLWASQFESSPGNETALSSLLLLPSWGIQSLSFVLGALSGFDYQFAGASNGVEAGPALAVLALVGLALRLRTGSIPTSVWAGMVVVLTLWALGVLASEGARTPDSPRYLYPGAVALLLVASGLAQPVRWSKVGLIGLYVVAAAGVAVNLFLLKDGGITLRSGYTPQVKAGFAGLEVASAKAKLRFHPPVVPGGVGIVPGGQSPLAFPFSIVEETMGSPTAAYQVAVRDYGPLGYSLPQLRASTDELRTQADSILVAALGLKLEPVAAVPRRSSCERLEASASAKVIATLPRSGAVLESDSGGSVKVQRFAHGLWIALGELTPSKPSQLLIPADGAPDRWRLLAATPSLSVCRL